MPDFPGDAVLDGAQRLFPCCFGAQWLRRSPLCRSQVLQYCPGVLCCSGIQQWLDLAKLKAWAGGNKWPAIAKGTHTCQDLGGTQLSIWSSGVKVIVVAIQQSLHHRNSIHAACSCA